MNGARGTLAIIAMLGVVALMSAPSACGASIASSPDASSAGDASLVAPCSSGPPIAQGTQLPNVPKQADAGPCTRRCGSDPTRQTAGFYFLESLPSGACTDEPVCTLSVYDGCGHQGAQCECMNGEWRCGIVSRARVVCLDAGSD